MVFSELVDTTPIFGSQRRSYIAHRRNQHGVRSRHARRARPADGLHFDSPDRLYVLGAILMVIGIVIQDVVADAMSTEVVPRLDAAGQPRPEADVKSDLGMVQLLGRLALSAGILSVAGLSGWLASFLARETVFLIGLVVPGSLADGRVPDPRRKAANGGRLDWRILGGGMAFGAGDGRRLALGGVPLRDRRSSSSLDDGDLHHAGDRDARARLARRGSAILFTSIIIFAFRATPVGRRRLFLVDAGLSSNSTRAFYGILRQTAAIISIAAMWLLGEAADGIFRDRERCSGSRSSARCCRSRTSGCSMACTNGRQAHLGFGARVDRH